MPLENKGGVGSYFIYMLYYGLCRYISSNSNDFNGNSTYEYMIAVIQVNIHLI